MKKVIILAVILIVTYIAYDQYRYYHSLEGRIERNLKRMIEDEKWAKENGIILYSSDYVRNTPAKK